MKRLPPAKRNMLIVVIIATAGLIGLIYIFLILPQNANNRKLASDTKAAKAKWEQYKTVIKQSSNTAKMVEEVTAELKLTEKDVASGDIYSWTYDTPPAIQGGLSFGNTQDRAARRGRG